MSKSIAIQEKEKLSEDKFISKLGDFVEKKVDDEQLLLKFNEKWIWLFFETPEEFIYDVNFSRDFSKEEILQFIYQLGDRISFALIDIDI